MEENFDFYRGAPHDAQKNEKGENFKNSEAFGARVPSITKEEMFSALASCHGKELQEKFSRARVAVCGLGGLGSNIALTLARAGIGRLRLIDFDTVALTNLNRQQYAACQIGMYKADALRQNLAAAAPYVECEAYRERITAENARELLCGCDIICEAFDGAEDKAMLVNFALENFPEKYITSSSGMAGMKPANTIVTRRVTKRFYLCGDGESDVDITGRIFPSRVALCAAHQAHAVLEIIAENF